MNKILNLFDEKYVREFFTKKILPLYPDLVKIGGIEIKAFKKGVWGEFWYHVVLEFKTDFVDKEGMTHHLPIFCTAHSDEPRKNVYTAMKYLWENGFNKGHLTSPHPLYYSNEYKASFYRGIEGQTLYNFIRNQDLTSVRKVTINAARLYAKLHKLPTKDAKNFNKKNSRIETTIPGVPHILNSLEQRKISHVDTFRKAYDIVVKREKDFICQTDRLWLVHGDAHPENIIKMSERTTGVIDFTDLCLSDFARDLGTFTQQLEYMCERKIEDKKFNQEILEVFLENYLKYAKIELTEGLKQRIDLYYIWTTMRTATFFFIKDKPEPDRGEILVEKFKQKLGL